MLTIFSYPKPFHRKINLIQRNAIRSWLMLREQPEIILMGNDEGTEDISKEFGLKFIPDIERNKYGTPLLSSVFSLAQQKASSTIFCYINTDIILTSEFMQAVSQVKNS